LRPERPLVHVVAGIVADDSGRVLITQRPPGKHLAGSWEFPGGKRAPGESRLDALVRELREELDLRVDQARPLIRYRHDYPDFSVDLDVWRIQAWRGAPRGLEGQAVNWAPSGELRRLDLLPADRPIITALLLPQRYLVTGPFGSPGDFEARLGRALEGGVRLVQLRIPGADEERMEALALLAARACRGYAARLLINGPPETAIRVARASAADGIHLPSGYLDRAVRRPVPEDMLFGVSCHHGRDLAAAMRVGADFAVLGPVLATMSHPGAATLGWPGFRELIADVPLPVYAIGGMTDAEISDAWRAGAQGIAAITAFW
jgi:8-oxo-dGTP diphosphatase